MAVMNGSFTTNLLKSNGLKGRNTYEVHIPAGDKSSPPLENGIDPQG